jgi:hypothetical protein
VSGTETRQLTLFVYTDDAELADDARQAMVTAGYLPVRVKSLDSYRIVEKTVRLAPDHIDKIGQAALWAVQGDTSYDQTAKAQFVNKLGELTGVWVLGAAKK